MRDNEELKDLDLLKKIDSVNESISDLREILGHLNQVQTELECEDSSIEIHIGGGNNRKVLNLTRGILTAEELTKAFKASIVKNVLDLEFQYIADLQVKKQELKDLAEQLTVDLE